MEEIKIKILQSVIDDLNDLIEQLFIKEYFGFEETARIYVDKIFDFIINDLQRQTFKITPKKIKSIGHQYVWYKANNRTTWYIFFMQKEHKILVTYITNNYSKIINELN